MAGLNLTKYLKIFKKDYETYTGEAFDNLSNNEKLIYLYSFYHYIHADVSNIVELQDHITFEVDSTDHIDAVFIDEEEDDNDIDLIITGYFPDKDRTGKDVFFNEGFYANAISLITDAESYYKKNISDVTSFRKKLSSIFKNIEYHASDKRPLKIKYLTNLSPKTSQLKKKFLKALAQVQSSHKDVTYEIIFGTDLECEILEIEDPRGYVEEAQFLVDSDSKHIEYGKEKSLVINISAKSLKNVYDYYENRGLFAQNLRFYIKNKKIDENIVDTINNYSDCFWYYNNGIIIICDEYQLKNCVLTLKNFSIINGGQTTKLIGETEFDDDFYLLCKLIKNKEVDEASKIDFIANVAEASNTQKPIKDKDAIANRKEQRALKKQLSDIKIYCQIKRGEKVNKKLYPEPWQNTKNDEIGQLLLSFMYQLPGAARSNKASIYSNTDRYALLFNKAYDSYLLKDLLYLKAYYTKWLARLKKYDDESDEYKKGLTRNGMLFMVAIIGVLCKLFYHKEYLTKVKDNLSTHDDLVIMLSQYDIGHTFFNHNLQGFEMALYEFFDYCYVEYFRSGYEYMKVFKDSKLNAFSNFTKTDNNFKNFVLKTILQAIRANDIFENSVFEILHQATKEESDHDKELLDLYVTLPGTGGGSPDGVTKDVKDMLVDALTDYRTRTFKKYHIKPYEVFRDVSRSIIANNAPKTLEELAKLKCLNKKEFDSYGDDIVKVVNKVLAKKEREDAKNGKAK